MWMAVRRFQSNVVSIKEDTRNGKTTIAITWTDPIVAAKWANEFVALANELLRTRAMDDAQRNIAYLNSQIAKESLQNVDSYVNVAAVGTFEQRYARGDTQ